MKTLGVIGGIGPESTIEYYRHLIATYRALKPDGSYPAIVINSINVKTLLDMIEANDRVKMTEFLLGEIQKLASAGAQCGLLAANTPHIVFDEIRRQSPIPLVSIVEATCEAAQNVGFEKTRTVWHQVHHARPVLCERIFQGRHCARHTQPGRASLYS